MLKQRNLDNVVGQSSSVRILGVLGVPWILEVLSDKDLGVIHKFLEINKSKTGLLLEKQGL